MWVCVVGCVCECVGVRECVHVYVVGRVQVGVSMGVWMYVCVLVCLCVGVCVRIAAVARRC